jgi:hypothetical protein
MPSRILNALPIILLTICLHLVAYFPEPLIRIGFAHDSLLLLCLFLMIGALFFCFIYIIKEE